MTPHLRRALTSDRGPPIPGDGPPLSGRATEPLEVGTIGSNRSLLPDGSLLCRNVPIARTGWMNYGPGEVPLDPPTQPGAAPLIYVHRGPEDLFNDETMRSFIGCAVTDQHPPVPVTPQNFAHLGKGFILNVRRGEGADSDCLMADIIIKDRWLIDRYGLDQEGPVTAEVSCGYEASYIQTGDGQGRQVNIIGNHLALVEKGRCGPRCAIGDEDTLSSTDVNHEESMTTQTQKPAGGSRPRTPLLEARQRVTDAMADLEAAEAADAGNGVHVHVHVGDSAPKPAASGEPPKAEGSDDGKTKPTTTLDAAVEERFAKIETAQAEIHSSVKELLAAVKAGTALPSAKPEGEDLEEKSEATATMDSAALANSYQQFLANAEILVPGFKLPTFDAALKRHATVDRMCQGRRMALAAYAATADGVRALGGLDIIGADCKAIAVAFNTAASAKAAANNRSATGDASHLPQGGGQPTAPKRLTQADINKANAEYWAKQGPRA